MWFALVCIIEDNYQIQAPGSLYLEGLIVGGIFGFQIGGGGGGGFYTEGLIFGILRYVDIQQQCKYVRSV